jgi:TolB-like protein
VKLSIALILVLSLCICACGSKNYSGELKDAQEKITVGVLYFDLSSNNKNLEPYRTGLTDMFTVKLVELLPEFNVVERAKLDKIMSEFELSETGALDPQTIQKLGRLLGAQTLYLGHIVSATNDSMCIGGKLVRVETGLSLAASQEYCAINDKDVFKTVDKVSKLLATRIRANYKELAADSLYYKGLTMEENGDKDKAINYYQRALQYSPKHEYSQQALKRLKS